MNSERADEMFYKSLIDLSTTDLFSVCPSGRSSLNFVYNLMEDHEGIGGGISLMEGRPTTGRTLSIIFNIFYKHLTCCPQHHLLSCPIK